MGTSVSVSDVNEIVPKTSALELKSRCVSKTRGLDEWARDERALKRERGENSGEGARKRRKIEGEGLGSCGGSRESVELEGSEDLDLVLEKREADDNKNGGGGLSVWAEAKIKPELSNGGKVGVEGGNMNDVSKVAVAVSPNLVDNVAPNPKRPRGGSRKKKNMGGKKVTVDVGSGSCVKVDKFDDDSVIALAVPQNVKRKGVLSDVKENGLSGSNSGKKGSAVRNCSVKVECEKGEEKEQLDRLSLRGGKPSTASSRNGVRLAEVGHLEENAARMLSSMKGSSQANGDADRVLRPRSRGSKKDRVKRLRRHFYEISSKDLIDAKWVLNKKAKVLWPLDNKWYFGLFTGYDPLNKKHKIKYDDREEEWIDLHKERFKLLLFPNEAPKRSRSRRRTLDKCLAEVKEDLPVDDDSCAGSLDSEPIISWLARSSRRVKSSPLGIIKRLKKSSLYKNSVPNTLSGDSVSTSYGSSVTEQCRVVEKSTIDRKVTCVYSRKRYHKKDKPLERIKVSSSFTFPASVADRVVVIEENDTAAQSTSGNDSFQYDCDGLLDFCQIRGPVELAVLPMKFGQVKLFSRNLLSGIHKIAFDAEDLWVYRAVFMQHWGTVTALWPRVKLEILLVDNVAGLRFVLFEGSLMEAVSFLCLVLVTFHQRKAYVKVLEKEMPVTSIRFELSYFHKCGSPLVFLFYNFLQIPKSNWASLDDMLKLHCSIINQLPLEECTNDNVKTFHSEIIALPNSSATDSFEVIQKEPKQGTTCMQIGEEPVHIEVSRPPFLLSEKWQGLPPFLMPFSVAPTFFLSLHLKLSMAKSIASVSFHSPVSLLNGSNNVGTSVDTEQSIDNGSQKQRALESTTGVCSSDKLMSTECDVIATSSGPQVSTGNVDDTDELQRPPCLYVESKNGDVNGVCNPTISRDNGCTSIVNGISVQIPSPDQPDSLSFDMGPLSAPQPTSDRTWSLTNGTMSNSPKASAPRSTWKHNRRDVGSMSFSHSSKMSLDVKANGLRKDPTSGSRKSYLLPFGGIDFSSKPRSHHRKGRTFKSLNDVDKVMPGCSRNTRRYPELLSCVGNVLITTEDRGWRVSRAHIVLEGIHQNDWKLSVKFSGETKYSYKAYQTLQPGSTNRYNHSMMWRGGRDWVLEFPDRVQWATFKEMHEECYNRNVRSSSFKTIPIPGVHFIEESDDDILAVPFVRGPKYFQQIGTEIDTALNPSFVLYDMDSDDEEWIANYRCCSDRDGSNMMEISDEMLERAMDVFEKLAYSQKCNCFTADEVEAIAVGVGPVDVMKAIYVHWQQKRRRIGMPLIRQLQPPLWQIYQNKVKEWETNQNKYHYLPKNCKPVLTEKPAMFAFCLRPRGMEVPNKSMKQRPQRKVYSRYQVDNGHHHVNGKKSNGVGFDEEKVGSSQNHDTLYGSQWQVSPRDAPSSDYFSWSSDESERSRQHQKQRRKKTKKMPKYQTVNDSPMMETQSNQRTNKRKPSNEWNSGLPEWPNQRQRVEQVSVSDLDEFTLRDAASAAIHASNMAKLKREKAQRLLYRADLAIHKAVVALMTAEAVNASSASTNDSMQED